MIFNSARPEKEKLFVNGQDRGGGWAQKPPKRHTFPNAPLIHKDPGELARMSTSDFDPDSKFVYSMQREKQQESSQTGNGQYGGFLDCGNNNLAIALRTVGAADTGKFFDDRYRRRVDVGISFPIT
ncbi:MAG TPA: hypothetical protein VGY98_14430 [Verrucomicrobiae bacterium]|nr:hypothetical protein [Verrucomicrobiae bacterium]